MHKLIFEGAELTGKSYLIHHIWDTLEKKYNSGSGILDGCTWINADIGLFGSKEGNVLLKTYIDLVQSLSAHNIIIEKFHLSQAVYSHTTDDYFFEIDNKLSEQGFKIVLTTFSNDIHELQRRVDERLASNAAYGRIVKRIEDYFIMQESYLSLLKKSSLPNIVIENSIIPNNNSEIVMKWLGES